MPYSKQKVKKLAKLEGKYYSKYIFKFNIRTLLNVLKFDIPTLLNILKLNIPTLLNILKVRISNWSMLSKVYVYQI